MFRLLPRILVLAITSSMFSLLVTSRGEAKDLTDVLTQGFVFRPQGGNMIGVTPGQLNSVADFSRAGAAVAPAFSAAVAQAVSQQVPLASITPAFVYRYNPNVDTFQRATNVPGPLFSERALTLGKGKWNFGVGYSYINYSDINGKPLGNLKSPGLITDIPDEEAMVVDILPTGETLLQIPFALSQIRTRIDLKAHLLMPAVRYGITERWEVSLALPIIHTSLRVRNEAVRTVDLAARIAVGGPEGIRILDPAGNTIDLTLPPNERDPRLFQFVKSQRPRVSLGKARDSATGVGDLTLRTKYQFWQHDLGGAAFGLNLQLPTGEARDFHGTEQTHVLPFLYFSQIFWGRFEPHLNLGIDFNADDVDRSSFLYTVGGALRVGKKLGVTIDFLGRSEFGRLPVPRRQENRVTGGILDRALDSCVADQPCRVSREIHFSAVPIKIKRNDILNFSFGLRYTLGTAGSVFFGGIVPLNDDGFRADFIPAGGIEYTF